MGKEKIYGKILALLREIKLHKMSYNDCFPTSFLIGNIGLQWWYTKKSFKLRNDLSKMIISSDKRFLGGDYEYFSTVIIDTIQNNGFNKDIFNSDLVFKSEADNLLEVSINSDYKNVSKKLYCIIENKLMSSIIDWMNLFPLTIIKSNSYIFESLDLALLAPSDAMNWEKISRDFKSSNGFNPSNGQNYNRSIIPAAYNIPLTWLIFKTNGTEKGARRKLTFTVRDFIAIVCSFKITSYDSLQNYIENDTPRYCILFPGSDTVDFNLQINSLPFLQPSFASHLEVDIETLEEIDSYIKSINRLNSESKKRFETATQFINYGLLASSDIERFMHFYIALDALFGEKNNVETSIRNGLCSLKNIDKKIDEKADRLFDLRNEILHGGSSSLRDWKGYEIYLTLYDVDPFIDIELICYRSIVNYLKFVKKI